MNHHPWFLIVMLQCCLSHSLTTRNWQAFEMTLHGFQCIIGHIYLKFIFLRILPNYYITLSSFWSSGTGSILLDTCHLTDCDPCRGGHMTNQIWSDQKPFDSFKLSLNETFLTWKCQERTDKGDDDEFNEQINWKIRKIFTDDERFSKNLERKKFLNLR